MSLIQRNSNALLPTFASVLSPAQFEMDALQNTFQHEAGNFSNLLAMAGGGLAYKFLRSSLISAGACRPMATLLGLGGEVTTYRAAHQTFSNWKGETSADTLFALQGWTSTFLNFGLLKGVGRLAAGQTAPIAHALQSGAMVAGNQLAAHVGLAETPQGSLLKQFLDAEITNMAMIGGNALLGLSTGHSFSRLERSVDLRADFIRRPSPRQVSSLPAMHHAEAELPFEGSSLQQKLQPIFEMIRQGQSAANVAEALQQARISLEDVQAYTNFSDPNYAKHNYERRLLHRDEQLEALVLGWRPGQSTRGHNHRAADGSPVTVVETAVQGRAGEIRFEKSDADWRELGRNIQAEGQVMFGAEGLYHVIFNAGEGNMITLHLYWPPLDLNRGTYHEVDPWAIPIPLSDRVRNLQTPGPAVVSGWVRELQAQGVSDIINLGLGQNGFLQEGHIVAAIEQARRPATYGAVQGQAELIEAIREKYRRDHGVRFNEREVVVSNGGKSSLTLACQALFQHGETALILGPAWPSYREEVSLAGGKPVILLGKTENAYRISPAELEQALDANPETKVIILTNPSNPTGLHYSRSELEAFAQIAERRNLIVIADEIYDRHVYRGEFTAFSSLPRMRARTLTMNGGSEVYSLAGCRVTWLVGPEELIQGVVRLQATEAANTNTIAQAALNVALRGDHSFIRPQVEAFETRARFLVNRLNEIGLRTAMPEAAFYAFADATKYLNTLSPEGREIKTDIDLARYILETAHVAVVPGTYFFAPGNFRLAFGGVEIPELSLAMNRVEAALKALRPQERPPEGRALAEASLPASTPTPLLSPFSMIRERLAPYAVPALALASMWQGVNSGMALLAGIATALTVGNPYSEQTSKVTKPLLAASLVGLGAGMDLHAVARAGLDGFGYTLGSIAVTLGLGKLIGHISKIERHQRILIDSGTAICGGSAIAAATQALGLKPKDPSVSVALGTVFTLNSLALLLFPMMGHQLHMSQRDFGLWAALAIHDTSSVVGAASGYGPEALEVATTVKLARALWIFPLSYALNALERHLQAKQENPGSKPPFPKFVLGFLAAAAATTFIPELKPAGDFIAHRSHETMRLTLFLIGANMNWQTLRRVGLRPYLHGTALWITMGALSLLGIEEGWIR